MNEQPTEKQDQEDDQVAEVEDIAVERAEKAEKKAVGGNTVLHNAYRGRK